MPLASFYGQKPPLTPLVFRLNPSDAVTGELEHVSEETDFPGS